MFFLIILYTIHALIILHIFNNIRRHISINFFFFKCYTNTLQSVLIVKELTGIVIAIIV